MNPTQSNINAVVAVLAEYGLKHAVICPGSRNAPLVMAFARNPNITCHSVIDERSAGFIALGMAIESNQPVVLICTSGSAVLNFYPAIVEAFYMQIPLIVISADRPPELIDKWDGQAIHQTNVFSSHVKASFNWPEILSSTDRDYFIKQTIKVFESSINNVKGPVHLNIPLREPLYTEAQSKFDYPKIALPEIGKSKVVNDEYVNALDSIINSNKILILHGAGDNDLVLNEYLQIIKQSQNCVIVSDILSGQHTASSFLNWESLLLSSDENQKQNLVPDVLISTGKMILNKQFRSFLKTNKPKRHWHIAENGYYADPFDSNATIITTKVSDFFEKLTENFKVSNQSNYYSDWNILSESRKKNESGIIESEFNELLACKMVLKALPNERLNLHLANSMSVRLAAYNAEHLSSNWKIKANRGVSGIDGCTSTALGASSVSNVQNFLITGDLAFFYDVNAFLGVNIPENFKIIILNNNGGGIFRNVEGAPSMPEAKQYLYTPHNLNASHIATQYGINYIHAHNQSSLELSLSEFINTTGNSILEIFTNPEINSQIFKQYKTIQI